MSSIFFEFDKMSGKMVNGFLFGELIGKGAFGAVYSAVEQKALGGDESSNPVAVKVSTKREETYFESEILRSLMGKRGFPRWLGYFENSSLYYMVSKLGYSKNLEKLKNQNRDRSFAQETVQVIAYQLLNALEVLHSKNTVHADVKPANILLTIPDKREKRVRVMLSDFGISVRYVDGMPTSAGQFDYFQYPLTSPFVENGGHPKPRDDITQLCVTLLSLSGHALNELDGNIRDGRTWKKSILHDPRGVLDPDFFYLANFLETVGFQRADVKYEELRQKIDAMVVGYVGNRDLKMRERSPGDFRLD